MDPKVIANRKALAIERTEKALDELVKKHNFNDTTRNAIQKNHPDRNSNDMYRIETIAELVESLLQAAQASQPGTGNIPKKEIKIKNTKAAG